MRKIITLGGSNSKNSINRTLAEYVGGLLDNAALVKIDLNDFDLPIFSVDLEKVQGFPRDAIRLNNAIEEADGFVISLAEHNGAYSAAFKNAFDWLSRIEGKVWRNKPMLLLSTSPGARGGQSVLEIAEKRFPYMGGNIIGSLSFPSFNHNFKEGGIVDAHLKASIIRLAEKFKKSF